MTIQRLPARAASVAPSIFERLADIAADRERDADSRITAILELIADGLDLGLTFLARADEETLHIERVCDRAGMGLSAGAAIPLRDTYCRVLLSDETDTLVVEDAASDARFSGLATTRDLGIGAYTGVSLQRADGSTYGTLCTLHPQPRALQDGEVSLLRLAGRLIMQAVEAVALREQEARYRALAEHGADLLCILAPDGSARYGSPSYTHVLGAPVEELHRRAGSPLGVIHPDDRAHVQAAMRACVRDGCPSVTLTCRHRHADGSYRTLEAIAVNRLADPTIRGIIVTSRDVTARVQAEERLRALTEAATDAIVAADAVGRILSWNAAAAHLFGYSAEEAIGQPLTLLIPERYHDAHEQGLRRVSAGGDARLLGSTVALMARCKDGSEFPCELSLSSWETDEGRCYSGIIRDVTERQTAEAALRQSEERLRALVRNAPLVLSEIDAEGVFTFSAGRGLDAMGLPQHASVGHSAFELYHDQPALIEGLRRVLAGEETTVTVTLRGVPFEAFYTPQRDAAGRITGAIAVAVDVSARTRAEAALHRSEEQFRLYFEHAALGMAVFGLDGHFLRVNAAFCAMVGYSAEELLALRVQDLDAPDGVEATEARLRQIHAGARDSFQFERRYRRRDGREVWIEVNATLVRDAQGHPLYIVNQMQDITARKEAEAALRQSEERFRLLFDEAPTGMALAAPDGHLMSVNPALCQMLGYAEQELLAQGTPLLTLPHDIPESRALIADLLAGESQSAILEKRYLHRDGHVVWTTYTATLLRDEAGQPLYFIFHLHDITARKQAEAARTRLATLVEASDDAIFGKTLDGIITAWNAGAERLYGYSAAEIVGQSVARLIPSDRPTELTDTMCAVARGETLRQYETARLHKDGTRVVVALTIAPIRDRDGTVVSASVVARDISARKAAEAALRASEERFRTLIEQAPIGACLMDEHGRFEMVNDAFAALYGYAPGELLGQHASVVIPPARRAAVTEQLAARIASGESGLREHEVVTKQGHALTVLANTVQILGADGRPRRASFAVDITARARMEEALREAEERLRAVYGAMSCGVLVLDSAGAVVEVNAAGQEIIGLDAEALRAGLPVNRHVAEMLREDGSVMPPRERPSYRALVTGAPVCDVLMGFRRLDGGERWVQMDAVPILDRAGVVRHVVVSFTDITARRAAEQALRASEERYRQVQEHAPIGLALVAPDGRFLRINPALCALVGYNEDELLARSFQDITHPDDLNADLAYVQQILAGEIATYQMEKRYLRKDGSIVWILLSVSLVRDESGQPLYFISQIQNIDARKRAEATLEQTNRELARSNAELEQFTRVASHDLRSPLNSIGGFAQLLRLRYKGRLDAHADEYLDFITAGVARMQALIDALLTYARLDSRAAPFAPVNTAGLVRDALANLHAPLEEAGATVEVGALPTVLGDATQLGQVMQNLIGNALKFRRPGVAPTLQISAEQDGDAWIVAVRDNGIGLDPTQAERIFAMFGRLHTREEYDGTGIGLAVCQKIVERHGGRIWVESEPGQGATFRFTLPA